MGRSNNTNENETTDTTTGTADATELQAKLTAAEDANKELQGKLDEVMAANNEGSEALTAARKENEQLRAKLAEKTSDTGAGDDADEPTSEYTVNPGQAIRVGGKVYRSTVSGDLVKVQLTKAQAESFGKEVVTPKGGRRANPSATQTAIENGTTGLVAAGTNDGAVRVTDPKLAAQQAAELANDK